MTIGLCFLIQFFIHFQTSISEPDTYLHLHVNPRGPQGQGAAPNTFQAPLQTSRSGIDYGLNNQETNIGKQEKENGATEVPPSTEASVDQSGDEIHDLGVNCGGHRAESCSVCPQDGTTWHGYTWCNGDCEWRAVEIFQPAVDGFRCSKMGCPLECVKKMGPTVSCGAHRADTCAQCPLDKGELFCNGDCAWWTMGNYTYALDYEPHCESKSDYYANDDDERGKRRRRGKSKRKKRPKPYCRLPPETGMCRGAVPSWYYDSKKGKCKRFTWGGCMGNANRFKTSKACKQACGDTATIVNDSKMINDDPIKPEKGESTAKKPKAEANPKANEANGDDGEDYRADYTMYRPPMTLTRWK